MPGFLVRPEDVGEDELVLRDAEAHHAVHVRRLNLGDRLEVGDGVGHLYEASITAIGPQAVHCRILARQCDAGESRVRLMLAAAVIKGSRFDYLIEKATEVGVDSIVPLLTRRCVVGPGSRHKEARWERLAVAAAKQSGRSRVPAVEPTQAFAQVMVRMVAECQRVLIAVPGHEGAGMGQALAGGPWHRLGLVIGPEGGFSADEIALAQEAGLYFFSWGQRVLRAETAGAVLSALVLNEAEGRLAD